MHVFFLIHNLVWYIPAREYMTCFSRPRVGNLTQKNCKSQMPGGLPAPPPRVVETNDRCIVHRGYTFHLSYLYWTVTSLYENTMNSITVTVHKLTY